MAITTMDGMVAGLLPGIDIQKNAFTAKQIGTYCTPIYTAGLPGAIAAPTPGINGAVLTSYSGLTSAPGAVAGKNVYLVRYEFAHAGGVGGSTIIDRIWHNSNITITTTTAQTITFPGLPARDNNGTTSGVMVMAGLEVSTTLGNAAVSNTTITYTNSAGTSGRTGTLSQTFPATATQGTFIPFSLQAGDYGIQSIQSITLGTSYVSGTMHLVMYREIASLGVPLANVSYQNGPIDLGLPRIYDNSVLQKLYLPTATAIGVTNAQYTFAQG